MIANAEDRFTRSISELSPLGTNSICDESNINFISKALASVTEPANTSVKVELISVETEEGQQFWNLGGIGAMLRFKI